MPPRKGKKGASRGKIKKRAAKPKLAAARVLVQDPLITINSDGTYDPPGGVSINPGGVVKFEVTYPPGTSTCYLSFGPINFRQDAMPTLAAVGTIKVGSGG